MNADKNASKEDGDEDFFTYRKKDDGLIAKEEDEYKKFLLQHMASVRITFLYIIQKPYSYPPSLSLYIQTHI